MRLKTREERGCEGSIEEERKLADEGTTNNKLNVLKIESRE